MPTSRPIARLAVDANVILSALIGGQARRAFVSTAVGSFHTAEAVLAEVRRYLPVLAHKYSLDVGLLELTLASLPVDFHPEAFYAEYLEEAARRVGARDPDDVHLLALALKLDAPIWSNDQDFAQAGVEWWTTAQLLAALDQNT